LDCKNEYYYGKISQNECRSIIRQENPYKKFGNTKESFYLCRYKAVPVRLGFSSITFKRRECYTCRWRADMHRICDVGSDYKGGAGAQILLYSEFHHIIGTAFFISV
jgi:hypothetical protein